MFEVSPAIVAVMLETAAEPVFVIKPPTNAALGPAVVHELESISSFWVLVVALPVLSVKVIAAAAGEANAQNARSVTNRRAIDCRTETRKTRPVRWIICAFDPASAARALAVLAAFRPRPPSRSIRRPPWLAEQIG